MFAFAGSRTWGWQPSWRLTLLGVCRCWVSCVFAEVPILTPALPLLSFHLGATLIMGDERLNPTELLLMHSSDPESWISH